MMDFELKHIELGSEHYTFSFCTRIKKNYRNFERGQDVLDGKKTISDYAGEMLDKILGLDPRSRNVAVEMLLGEETDEQELSDLHSMDIFLKLFLECSYVFRPIFISQATKCQLSLPLIVTHPHTPNPTFYALPYSSILSQSYCVPGGQARIIPIFTEQLHFISFIRIGSCTQSLKSRSLNQILDLNDCFFSQSTEGSSTTRILFEGLIEMNWFLPRDNNEDCFHEPLMFLNLRGDALKYPQLLKFILDVSSLVYIFITLASTNQQEIETILDTHKHKTCLVIMDSKNVEIRKYRPLTEQEDKNFYFIAKLNMMHIPREITVSIRGILGKNPDFRRISLQECKSVALKHRIDVDDDNEDFRQKQAFQEKIDQTFRDFNVAKSLLDMSHIKSTVLPLQLGPWENRAQAVRDEMCIKSDTTLSIDQREKIQRNVKKRLNQAREEQITFLINPSGCDEFIIRILTMIKDNLHQDNSLAFLWHTLKNSLDRLTLEYSFLSKTHTENKEQPEKVCNSLFGIEHIMRELGQLYETFINARQKRDEISKKLDFNVTELVVFAAKMITSGHSLELLDGAVTHVPHIWVGSVLKELGRGVGEDKRIFVVGILGIQSSGKSTLLNTMFGLQFPVSAGRCTRGIFMQMIAVERDSELGYDYLVVLDTEGLNATELIGKVPAHHDNELATFVVGLSDLTIVNLMGENESNFKDILPITVLALIRMQLSYAKPKCIFVHQNVADMAARQCLAEGRNRLMKILDENAQKAAEQEGLTEAKKFNDVIDYDIENDTHYLPGLFTSPPPMSVVCSEYSKKATVLRNKITHEYSKKTQRFLTFREWSRKLKHIWDSLLSQNFVLGYKNVLELCAAIEFDEVLNKWASVFESQIIHFVDQVKTLFSNSHSNDIDTNYQHSKAQIIIHCTEDASREQAKALDYLFNESTNRGIFLDWKERADEFFYKMRQKKRDKILDKIELHYKLRKKALVIDERFYKIRDDILQKAKDDIIEINSQDDWSKPTPQLEILFEKHWDGWDQTLKQKEIFSIDIHRDLQQTFKDYKCLNQLNLTQNQKERLIQDCNSFVEIGNMNFQLGSDHYTVFNPKTKEIDSGNCTFLDFHDYVQHHRTKQNIERNDLMYDRIITFIEVVSVSCEKFLESLSKSFPYSITSFENLLVKILNQFDEFNERERNNSFCQIILKDLFMYEFCFYHCCKAIPKLESLHDDFLLQSGTQSQLDSLKKHLQPIFIEICQGAQVELGCAKALADIVFQKMNYFLENKLGADVPHFFQNDIKNFEIFKRRSSLQIEILKDLAEARNFQRYISYISDPINYIRNWIEERFLHYCNNEDVHKEFKVRSLDPSLEKLKLFYRSQLSQSIADSKKDWKNNFYERIKSQTRELRRNDFDILDVYQNPIHSPEDFVDYFIKSFENMCTPFNWLRWIKSIIKAKLRSNTQYLIKVMVRCQSLCPFCREPCILSSQGHKHYCGSLHRPKGLAGYYHQVSNTFSIRECTQSMNTDDVIVFNSVPYKYTEYRNINPDFASWNILGEDALESKYWQWVFYTFSREFIKHYNYRYNPVIENWSYITQEDVFANLDMHNENFMNKGGSMDFDMRFY